MSGRQCRADTRKISQISSYGGETSWTRLQQRQSLLPTSVGRFQALVLPLNPMRASRLEPNRACSWPCTSVCKQRTRELVLGWLRLAGCSKPTSPQQRHAGGSRRDRRARRSPAFATQGQAGPTVDCRNPEPAVQPPSGSARQTPGRQQATGERDMRCRQNPQEDPRVALACLVHLACLTNLADICFSAVSCRVLQDGHMLARSGRHVPQDELGTERPQESTREKDSVFAKEGGVSDGSAYCGCTSKTQSSQ